MQRFMLKSKVHRVRITKKDVNYEGSLSLDTLLMEAAKLIPFERIEVYNVNNGARFSTYVIPARPGSGEVKLNGAAARLGEVGDILIVASYTVLDERELIDFRPYLVYVDDDNRITEIKRDMPMEHLVKGL